MNATLQNLKKSSIEDRVLEQGSQLKTQIVYIVVKKLGGNLLSPQQGQFMHSQCKQLNVLGTPAELKQI